MALPLRELEGKYEILYKIKEGGMGAIYKVRHLLLDEVRVIKVIRPQFASDPALQQRFLREARMATSLRHPNIAQLYDFTVGDDGSSYMVMEFIDGVTLQELLQKRGPPTVALGVEIARQGLKALTYLHHLGFIHRDISPDNLMLSRDFEGNPRVKLIDLGIAKRLGGGEGLTQTGMFLGKVRYASPELFGGEGTEPSAASDLYSFGILLYELLTGVCPVIGESFSELISFHLFRPPLPFEETDPEGRVPAELRTAVLKTLEKEPSSRLGGARDLLSALDPFRPQMDEIRGELEETLVNMTSVLDTGSEAPTLGSTQDRIVQEFPPVTTPTPAPALKPVPVPPDEVRELLSNAQLLARLEQNDKAEHELLRLLELQPDHGEARDLLSSVQAAQQSKRQAQQRKRTLRKGLRRAERLLEQGRPEEALGVLEQASDARGEDPDAVALRQRIDIAIERRREEEEHRQRAEALAQARHRIEGLLAEGRLDKAQGSLDEERKTHGADAALDDLGRRIAAARERRQRERALAAECAAIGRLVKQGSYVKAQERHSQALATHGESEVLDAALREVEDHRRRAIAVAAESIASSIAAGELEHAARELKFATGRCGEAPGLMDLGSRIEQARASRETAARQSGGGTGGEVRETATAEMPAPPEIGPEADPVPPLPQPGPSRRRVWVLGVALAALAVLAVGGLQTLRRDETAAVSANRHDQRALGAVPSEAGTLVLQALPWAQVTSIVDQDGADHLAGVELYTPLHLPLPPGTYTIRLRRTGAPEPVELTVELAAGERIERTVQVGIVDLDAYFSKH